METGPAFTHSSLQLVAQQVPERLDLTLSGSQAVDAMFREGPVLLEVCVLGGGLKVGATTALG